MYLARAFPPLPSRVVVRVYGLPAGDRPRWEAMSHEVLRGSGVHCPLVLRCLSGRVVTAVEEQLTGVVHPALLLEYVDGRHPPVRAASAGAPPLQATRPST